MKSPNRMLITTLSLTLLSSISLQAEKREGNGNPNPGAVPPHAVYKGKTAGEWTAAWWQWVRGTEGSVQMLDETGEHAHVNNNGEDGVFFLAKSWTGMPEVRHIKTSTGTPLYVPLMGWGPLANPGQFLGFFGSLESLFMNLFDPHILGVHDLSLEVNGVPLAALEDGNLHYLNFIEDGGDLIIPIWMADGTELEIAGYGATNWAVVAPDGRYDANDPGDVPVFSWVLKDDPMTPLPVEVFGREYYEPGLLRRTIAGDPMAFCIGV